LKHPLWIYNKISWSVSAFVAKLGFSPNQITILRLSFFVPPSMFFFSLGDYLSSLIGLVFYHLFMFFDFVDGQVAHLRSMQTSLGSWLDPFVDIIGKYLIVFSLILGLHNLNAKIVVWIIGFSLLFVDKLASYMYRQIFSVYNLENEIRSHDGLIKNVLIPLTGRPRFPHPLSTVFSFSIVISLGVLFNQVFIALLFLLLTHSLQLGAEFFILYKKAK